MVHIRHVPNRSERQGNRGLRDGSVELCSRGGLLGMCPKSHIG